MPNGSPRGTPRFEKSMETKFLKDWGKTDACGTPGLNGSGHGIGTKSITDKKTKYFRLGYQQNARKVEMAKCGAATTKKRGPIKPTK